MEINEFNKIIAAITSIFEAKLSENIAQLIKNNIRVQSASRSTEIKDLFAALAKAQMEMPIAGLTNQNPYFKSRYADLAEVVRASRPYLSKNGLAVAQQILVDDNGANMLHTILGHVSGQWMESTMRILPPKNDIQSIGSYITYLRRYSYASLVGLVSGNEDDDGEVAMIEAREIVAKGPSTKYNPREQSTETISKDQLEQLEYELQEIPDFAEEILYKMQLQSLADLPKSKFQVSIDRIREVKLLRKGVKK